MEGEVPKYPPIKTYNIATETTQAGKGAST